LAPAAGATPAATVTPPPGGYPLFGHAPDFSWVAGRIEAWYQPPDCSYDCGCALLRYGEDGPPAATLIQLHNARAHETTLGRPAPAGVYRVVFGHKVDFTSGTPEAVRVCSFDPVVPPYTLNGMAVNPTMPDSVALLIPIASATPLITTGQPPPLPPTTMGPGPVATGMPRFVPSTEPIIPTPLPTRPPTATATPLTPDASGRIALTLPLGYYYPIVEMHVGNTLDIQVNASFNRGPIIDAAILKGTFTAAPDGRSGWGSYTAVQPGEARWSVVDDPCRAPRSYCHTPTKFYSVHVIVR
jgi:hypothetical protein